MNVFLIILAIFFVLLFVFYIFVNIRINAITKQRKEDVLNSLSEEQKNVIRSYIDACHVTLKDVFTKQKRNDADE